MLGLLCGHRSPRRTAKGRRRVVLQPDDPFTVTLCRCNSLKNSKSQYACTNKVHFAMMYMTNRRQQNKQGHVRFVYTTKSPQRHTILAMPRALVFGCGGGTYNCGFFVWATTTDRAMIWRYWQTTRKTSRHLTHTQKGEEIFFIQRFQGFLICHSRNSMRMMKDDCDEV